MLDEHVKNQIEELLFLALEGEISKSQVEQLNALIKNDPERIQYTIHYLQIFSGLKRSHMVADIGESYRALEGNSDYLMDSLFLLAEDEKTAPTIKIEQPASEKVPMKMLKKEKTPRVINKFSLYSAIISTAAALIFVLIYIKLDLKAASTVATITDGVNVQWEQGGRATEIGGRLWDNEGPRWLKKGTIKVVFDYGAEVIIEGPAEFEMESPDKMMLNSGRLYATVPEGAAGFTVLTPYSTVIDLGTEFGIEVGFDGSTNVHMFKGKASLIPGQNGDKKEGMELLAGQAKEVTQTGKVRAIQLQKQAFVRRFDSISKFLWRGESVNLADIVGSGNGFGTGGQDYGVAAGGNMVYRQPLYVHGNHTYRATGFFPIGGVDGIDGTFIPDVGKGPVYISSREHVFRECPDTTGANGEPVIINGARTRPDRAVLARRGRTYRDGQLTLEGVECGTPENPSIFMHANAGITFDLKKIQKPLPQQVRTTRFTALAGVPDNNVEPSCLDIWVLVDGQVRFSEFMVRTDQTFNIDIPLTGTERFLTLIVTDGIDDKNKKGNGTHHYDWCLFSRPYLELVSDE